MASHQRNSLDSIEAVLKELVNQGLKRIYDNSRKNRRKIRRKNGRNKFQDLLGTLTSGELTPVPLEKKSVSYTPSNQMNIPQLEKTGP
ncbi:hypothetical protein NQ314_009240 [Rhamnusium bicolor]|uniref:Uncharacterized protein n=1 Tax=Rhamnusium bicolor TaxID=1586634 RepID=A0AAV8Y3G3_9CUCU|nr:hypothetical protein NQ314_009240 [Rhamnusium bicolor]